MKRGGNKARGPKIKKNACLARKRKVHRGLTDQRSRIHGEGKEESKVVEKGSKKDQKKRKKKKHPQSSESTNRRGEVGGKVGLGGKKYGGSIRPTGTNRGFERVPILCSQDRRWLGEKGQWKPGTFIVSRWGK